MSCRIWPMPSFNSAAVCALTNRPRPLIAACQRSSTPELSGRLGVVQEPGGGEQIGVTCGHCRFPGAGRANEFSVAVWFSVGSLPCVPSDRAAKFKCCQAAGSLPEVGTLLEAFGPEVRRSVTQ